MYEEVFMLPRVLVKLLIQAFRKVRPSVNIPHIPVAQKTVKRPFKVVLYDRAMEFLCKFFPRLLPTGKIFFQGCIYLAFITPNRREIPDIPHTCVDKNNIRLEFIQFPVSENGIVPPLVVLTFIENRTDSVTKQKQIHYFDYIVRCGTAKDSYPLLKEFLSGTLRFLQNLFFNRFPLLQNQGTVKRIC